MLDINIFRTDKGANPELIRESQRRRNANPALVDEVIALDKEWIRRITTISANVSDYLTSLPILVRYDLDGLNKEFNAIQKEIGMKMKNKQPADDLLAKKNDLDNRRADLKKVVDDKEQERDNKLILIGNIVHASVPTSNDEVGTKLVVS